MTGDGIVSALKGDMARVRISKSSACGHDCASCGACSNPSYEISVINKIGACVGDRVLIETKTSLVLLASFLLYILPVFILIIAAILCEEYSLGLYGVFPFLLLGLLWFALIKLTNKRLKIKNTIVKILEKSKKD